METLNFSAVLGLMPVIDWLALGVLALAMAMGAWRGLLYGVISVCGWVGAFLLAGQFGRLVGAMLPLNLGDNMRAAAGSALVFVVVLFASGVAAHLVRRLAAAAGMRPVDRILGAAFGALQALLLGLCLVVMLGSTPVTFLLPGWKEAHSVRLLQQLWVQLAPLFPSLPQPTPPQAAPEKTAPAGAAAPATAPASTLPRSAAPEVAPAPPPVPLVPVEVSDTL